MIGGAVDDALAAAGVLVLELDREAVVRAASAAAPELLGGPAAELIGRRLAELLFVDHAVMADYQLVRGAATTLTTTWRWRRLDGEQVALTATWQRTATGWLGVVTRPSRAEGAVAPVPSATVTERLAHAGTFTIELATGRVTWSELMYELHDWDRRRPVPGTQSEYLPLGHPDDIAGLFAAATATLGTTGETEATYRMRTPEGGWRHLHTRMVAERDAAGTPRTITGVTRDVTADVVTRDELIRDRERARAEARAKTRYLAQVTHELRTPLGGVIGMLDLATAELAAAGNEHLASARASARHLLELIDDLLDASREESWHLNIVAIDFDLRDVIAQALAMVAPRARKKELRLEHHLGDLAMGRHGDPLRLRQVLINLLYNAVKYTPRGRVTLNVSAGPGTDVEFRVSDTGVGIAPEQQTSVFEPFVQGTSSEVREGVGLGLAITRELVTRLGGTIALRSEVGVGTVVTVRLPLPRTTGRISERLRAIDPGSTPALILAPTGDGLRVLVAEDHPTNAAICVAMLERAGHQVTVVGDGQAAVAAVARERFDVVLMDIEMPRMSGVEATQQIRADHHARGAPRLPIVALSAHRHAELAAAGAGMDAYLGKPLDALALAALLDRVARGELRPPIDHAARLAKVGGRAELARTIVETFRSHQPTLAEPLDAALIAGNLEEVRRAAHGLRGALLMVGAVEAAAVADALETAPLVEAKALRPRLHFELARAAAELALA